MSEGLVKKVRGVVKQFLPYGIEAAYVKERYGMADSFDALVRRSPLARVAGLAANLLPYGLVRAWRRRRFTGLSPDLPRAAEQMGLFDRAWYVAKNVDVDFSAVDPLDHFFSIGWREYRDPSENFSVLGYMSRYKDVMASGANPLVHFMLHGRWEGRDTCAPGPFLGGAPSIGDRLAAWRRARRSHSAPLFSVVVASYNYEDLVIETLSSLDAQAFRDFEVIVVDDGSTDSSRDAIRRYIAARPGGAVPMTLLTHPGEVNRGLAATVRLGVEASRGEFVAFCESDDIWTGDHLAALADFISRYGAAEVIANDVDIFGDTVRVAQFNAIKALRYKKLRHARNRISPAQFREMNYLLTFSATAVRRDVISGCDFAPVARPAALDWWLWRQVCFDRPVYFLNRVLTRWRMHDSYMFKTHSAEDQARSLAELQREFTLAADALLRRRHPFSLAARLLAPRTRAAANPYRMSAARRSQMQEAREAGREEFAEAIARNSGARILVALHLFYDEAWEAIAEYLENLRPYRHVDYVVTCVEDRLSEETLAKVRAFAPSVRVEFLPNRGFDVGPFVETLRGIDLGRYDIVFKLQSKGVRRPRIFIYDQLFKRADWFRNLFEGVLGARAVHEAVDALMNGGARLVAAENLIVGDPVHKQFFMRRFCSERALNYVEGYRFVAGTCFAMRAESLAPLKALGLTISDFAAARPGEFSLAHAVERWMCFAADGAMHGIPVQHPAYAAEVRALKAKSAIRMLDDPRFTLDYDFFYRVLEMRPVARYDVVRVRLGDLTRYWYDGRLYPLAECPPYKYLCGDKAAYDEYCRENSAVTGFEMTPERFERLCADMAEYDPKSMPVVLGPRNIIQDGQHRSCILLKRFGPDHEIDVVRII